MLISPSGPDELIVHWIVGHNVARRHLYHIPTTVLLLSNRERRGDQQRENGMDDEFE